MIRNSFFSIFTNKGGHENLFFCAGLLTILLTGSRNTKIMDLNIKLYIMSSKKINCTRFSFFLLPLI